MEIKRYNDGVMLVYNIYSHPTDKNGEILRFFDESITEKSVVTYLHFYNPEHYIKSDIIWKTQKHMVIFSGDASEPCLCNFTIKS